MGASPKVREIPLDLEPLLGKNLHNFRITKSPRRFDGTKQTADGFLEIDKNLAWYKTAPFGEVVLDFIGGKNRFQRVTVIYARILEAEKCEE